ncbi:MAG: phosphotransferase [Myxococcales bacterium]|nr:phosphotransferase [Myxococcales bacterium]USN49782.1 MAG: phosphotransferase [Myxococcales bacterium]
MRENIVLESMPSDIILEQAKELYDLDNFVFIRKMENIVYSAMQQKQKVYVRFTSPLRRARHEIRSELDWMQFLFKYGFSVPRIIKNKYLEPSTTLIHQAEKFEVCVFNEVIGQHPTHTQMMDANFLQRIGALIAKMHEATLHYIPEVSDFYREQWYEERGIRHAIAAKSRTSDLEMREKFEEMVLLLSSCSRNHENYGLIHSDIGRENILLEKNMLSVIDFDDSCFHWHVFDIAIVVYFLSLKNQQIMSSEMLDDCVVNLVTGYRSVRYLPDEEVELIPHFIIFAFLRLYFWIEDHQFLDTFHEKVKVNVEELKQKARDCVVFYS